MSVRVIVEEQVETRVRELARHQLGGGVMEPVRILTKSHGQAVICLSCRDGWSARAIKVPIRKQQP